MSPTKRYETPCCLCITSPQVRVKKMMVFDHLREISKVGLIALEKSVPRTYRIFCHPASILFAAPHTQPHSTSLSPYNTDNTNMGYIAAIHR